MMVPLMLMVLLLALDVVEGRLALHMVVRRDVSNGNTTVPLASLLNATQTNLNANVSSVDNSTSIPMTQLYDLTTETMTSNLTASNFSSNASFIQITSAADGTTAGTGTPVNITVPALPNLSTSSLPTASTLYPIRTTTTTALSSSVTTLTTSTSSPPPSSSSSTTTASSSTSPSSSSLSSPSSPPSSSTTTSSSTLPSSSSSSSSSAAASASASVSSASSTTTSSSSTSSSSVSLSSTTTIPAVHESSDNTSIDSGMNSLTTTIAKSTTTTLSSLPASLITPTTLFPTSLSSVSLTTPMSASRNSGESTDNWSFDSGMNTSTTIVANSTIKNTTPTVSTTPTTMSSSSISLMTTIVSARNSTDNVSLDNGMDSSTTSIKSLSTTISSSSATTLSAVIKTTTMTSSSLSASLMTPTVPLQTSPSTLALSSSQSTSTTITTMTKQFDSLNATSSTAPSLAVSPTTLSTVSLSATSLPSTASATTASTASSTTTTSTTLVEVPIEPSTASITPLNPSTESLSAASFSTVSVFLSTISSKMELTYSQLTASTIPYNNTNLSATSLVQTDTAIRSIPMQIITTTAASSSDGLLGLYIGVAVGGSVLVVTIIVSIIIICIVWNKKNKKRRSTDSRTFASPADASKSENSIYTTPSQNRSSALTSKLDERTSTLETHRGRGHTNVSRSVSASANSLTHLTDANRGAPWRQARLPVDLRSAAVDGNEHGRRHHHSGFVVNLVATGSARSSVSDDARLLVDSLLELKHHLEEYVQSGLHLERQPRISIALPSSPATAHFSPQYDVLAAVHDVSSRIADVTTRYSSTTTSALSPSGSGRLPPPELIGSVYIVEHLSALRPRIDRLARVLARSVRSGEGIPRSLGSTSAEVSSLETVLANVGASISLTIESMTETNVMTDSYHRSVVAETPTTQSGRSALSSRRSSRHADVHGDRVRRPPSAGNVRRPNRRRPRSSYLDPVALESTHQVRAVVSQLAIVRCRLQMLAELDFQQTVDYAGDVWWQAGLLVSLERLTEFLTELTKGDISHLSYTLSSVSDVQSTFARSLRNTDADFDNLLFSRLRAFHTSVDMVNALYPAHRIGASSNVRWYHWDVTMSQLVLDLLRDVLLVSRSLRRPPETIQLRPVHVVLAARPPVIGRTSNGSFGPSSVFGGTASSRPTALRHVAANGGSRSGTVASGISGRRHRTNGAGGVGQNQSTGRRAPAEHSSTSNHGNRVQQDTAGLVNGDAGTRSRFGSGFNGGSSSETNLAMTETGSEATQDRDRSVNDESDMINNEDDDQSMFDVVVDRTTMTSDSLLDELLTLYDITPVEDLRRLVKVTFTHELGVDAGALSREFFFLVFEALAAGRPMRSRSALQGARGHLLPSIDHVLTESRAFWFIGVLLVQALRRGCRGLPGLCDAVRHFLAAGARISSIGRSLGLVTMEDVADLELRTILIKLKNNREINDVEQSVLERWLDEAKFTKVLKASTINEAVQRIICHYIFDSRMVQLQAIAEGMAELGFPYGDEGDVIDVMFPRDIKLTVSDFMTGIVFDEDGEEHQSTVGSSVSRAVTQRTINYFQRYIDEVYRGKIGKLRLEDILQFINGAPYFSSLSAATVRFDSSGSPLPRAHACSSEIVLPTVHRSYSNFRLALTSAFEDGSLGFGVA